MWWKFILFPVALCGAALALSTGGLEIFAVVQAAGWWLFKWVGGLSVAAWLLAKAGRA